MNQQNFKLSDFGIDVKSESRITCTYAQCKIRRTVQQQIVHSRGYSFHDDDRHVQQVPMCSVTSDSSVSPVTGSNLPLLLQVQACDRSRSCFGSLIAFNNPNDYPRNGNTNQNGQTTATSASAMDRFQASSPPCNNLQSATTSSLVQLGGGGVCSSVPSPNAGYWKQYGGGGQESGVNMI